MIEFLETFRLLERWVVILIYIRIQIPIASPIGGGGCPIDIPIDIPIQIPIGSPVGGARCLIDIPRDIPIAIPRGGG